jgi:hypothetical protein
MTNKFDKMLNDLSKYKRDKNLLMQIYIENRLNKSLETYYSQLNSSLESLLGSDELKVLRRSNKI